MATILATLTNRSPDYGTADSHADDDNCRVHYGSHADQLDIETLAYAALAGVEPRPFRTGATLLNPAQAKPIRILGIDPGLRITGFGVIEKTGNKLAYLASGCIKTDAKTSLPMRLGTIYSGLRELVAQYQPDQAVIEIVFVNVNPQSTLLLGQARGAAITALVAGGVEVAEYTALQVKQAVVGNGHADKKQVQHMVRRLLSLPGDPSADAADALACAIAHAHGGQGLGALATKGFRVRNGRMIEGK